MEGDVASIHPVPPFIEVDTSNAEPSEVPPGYPPEAQMTSPQPEAMDQDERRQGQPPKQESASKELLCPYCLKKFSNELSLRTHVGHHNRKGEKRLHGISSKIIKKTKIKFTFNKPRRMLDKHSCNICHQVFVNYASLVRHQIVHSGDKPYKCDECDKSYTTKWSLQVHQRTNHLENPLRCKKCGETLPNEAILGSHTCASFMKTDTEKFQEAVTSLQPTIQSYFQTNPESTPDRVFHQPSYECRICNMTFSTPNALGGHMGSHRGDSQKAPPTSERPHREHEPPVRYTSPKSPRKVIYTTMTCTVCSKEFKYRLALKRHMVLHTDVVGPVGCPLCKEEPMEINSLLEHLSNYHTKHSCLLCHESFDYPSYLQVHMKTKHQTQQTTEASTFSCSVCLETFENVSQLEAHMGTHKTETNESRHAISQQSPQNTPSCSYTAGNHIVAEETSGQVLGEVKVEQVPKELQSTNQVKKELFTTNEQNEPMDLSAKPLDNTDSDVNNANIVLCTLCNAYFPKGTQYMKHQAWHSKFKEPLVPCPICHKKFTLDFNMKRHMKSKHKQMSLNFFCKKNVSQKKVVPPVRILAPKKTVFTVKPEVQSSPSPSPSNHLTETEITIPFRCKICNKGYTWYSFLQTHMLKEHNVVSSPPSSMVEEQKLFPCDLCSKAFTRKANLNLHMKTHSVDVPSNEEPGGHIKEPSALILKQEHSTTAQGIAAASESYATSTGPLDSAPMSIEDKPDQETVHYCHVCGKIFTSSKSLGQHSRSHKQNLKVSKPIRRRTTVDAPHRYYCSVCNLGFHYYCRLKTHMISAHNHSSSATRTTLGKKRHQCRFCHKLFLSGGAVGNHEKMHMRVLASESSHSTTSAVPSKSTTMKAAGKYQCNICGRQFATHNGLGGHMSSHNSPTQQSVDKWKDGRMSPPKQIRPKTVFEFRCEICKKVFASAQALGGHKRHHTQLERDNDKNNNTFAHEENASQQKDVKEEVVKEEIEIKHDDASVVSSASYVDVTATDSYSDTDTEKPVDSVPLGPWDPFVKKGEQVNSSNLAGMPERSLVFKLLSRESMKDKSQSRALAAIKQSVLSNRLIGESGFVLGSIHNPTADSPHGSDGELLGYLVGHPNGFGPFCCPLCSRRFPVPSHFANHLIFHADQTLDVAYLSNVFRPASRSASSKDCSCNLFGLTFNDCSRCVRGFSDLENLKRHVKVHVEKFIEYQVSTLRNEKS